MLALAIAAGTALAEFKAGFARVDATPPLGIPLVGYFSHRVADGVLDPLYIDCVAVSDGTNNALIYCVDDLHLTRPFMEKAFSAITAATGIPRDRIYVHATHIHTGPSDWKRPGFSEEENRLVMSFADTRVAKMADVGKLAVRRQQTARHAAPPEHGTEGRVPAPGGNAEVCRLQTACLQAPNSLFEGCKLRGSYRQTLGGQIAAQGTPKVLIALAGQLHIVDKDAVALLGPQCRQVAQVTSQLPPGMGSREIAETRG